MASFKATDEAVLGGLLSVAALDFLRIRTKELEKAMVKASLVLDKNGCYI